MFAIGLWKCGYRLISIPKISLLQQIILALFETEFLQIKNEIHCQLILLSCIACPNPNLLILTLSTKIQLTSLRRQNLNYSQSHDTSKYI
ncbi:hypothetical protein BLOT_016676 [Blomia tropicalis]|nr:hypothetical protein BLOT_016676 [Blomia tropicalis]